MASPASSRPSTMYTPAGERGRGSDGAAGSKKGVVEAQIGELDRRPASIWRQFSEEFHPRRGLLAYIAHHGPGPPVEIILSQRCAFGSFNSRRVGRLVEHASRCGSLSMEPEEVPIEVLTSATW